MRSQGEGGEHAVTEPVEAPSSPYLTVEEAAQIARCNPRTIRRAFEKGALRAFRPAHRILLLESDVRAWVESSAAVRDVPQQAVRSRQRRDRSVSMPGSVTALREIEREMSR
jgi:excisionase family DNA binding protein